MKLTVSLSPPTPREVRQSLQARYAGSMERSLLDDATLLASEIVTNAVQQLGCPEGIPVTTVSSIADDVLRHVNDSFRVWFEIVTSGGMVCRRAVPA